MKLSATPARPTRSLPKSAAARVAIVYDMLKGIPIEDEDGNVIGRGPPLITEAQAKAALESIK